MLFSLPSSIKFDGDSSSTGNFTIWDTDFTFEMTPQVSRSVWIVPRAQLGFSLLFAGGDLKKSEQATKLDCENDTEGGCDTIDSPHLGFNFGIGAGVLFAVSEKVRLRADLMYQFYVYNLSTIDSSLVDAKLTTTLSGGRGFLLGGVEF